MERTVNKKNPDDDPVDAYLDGFAPDIREKLRQIRSLVKRAVPNARERMGYGMPALYLNGYLLYYAAFKDHISLFPTSSGIKAFADEIRTFTHSKGTVQFPFDKPLPLALIRKIAVFRARENRVKRPRKPRA
jgi:uncharacterized protein YdhG (YjbR/CyaY superfamily)